MFSELGCTDPIALACAGKTLVASTDFIEMFLDFFLAGPDRASGFIVSIVSRLSARQDHVVVSVGVDESDEKFRQFQFAFLQSITELDHLLDDERAGCDRRNALADTVFDALGEIDFILPG